MLASSINTQLSPLGRNQVGFLQTHKPEKGIAGWVAPIRGILTALEVVVGVALASTGVGIAFETGVGLAFGAAQQAVSSASGTASVTDTLFNFASPLVFGALSGAGNLRRAGKIIKETEAELLSSKSWFKQATQELEQNGGTFSSITNLQAAESSLDFYKETYRSISSVSLFQKADIATAEKLFEKGFGNTGFVIDAKNMAKLAEEYRLLGKVALVGARNIDDAVEIIGRNNKKISEALGITEEQFDKFLSIVKSSLENNSQIKNDVLLNELGTFLKGIGKSNNLKSFATEFVQNLKAVEKAVGKEVVETEAKIYRAIEDTNNSIFKKKEVPKWWTRKAEESTWKHIRRVGGSAKFNDKVVQRVQLIDPNDLGRAPVEAAYKYISKKIAKRFAKKLPMFDKALEVKGLYSFNNSQWIETVRLLGDNPLPAANNLYRITFNPNTTNNKRAVLVWMNSFKHKKFITTSSPGRFYLRNFATAKPGGGLLGLLFPGLPIAHSKMSNKIENWLGIILPVQLLRNVYSLTSNIVENISAMQKGDYTKTYWKKLSGSFIRTAVNRSQRLLFRAVLGGYARNLAIGKSGIQKYILKSLGREVQKYVGVLSRNTLTVAINNRLNGTHRKVNWNKIGKDYIGAAAGSVRTGGLHYRRSVLKIRTPSRQAVLRHLKLVPRSINTVLPGRPFNGFKYK